MRQLIAAEFRKLFGTRLWLWLLLAAMDLTALFVWVTIVGNNNPASKVPTLSSLAGQHTVLSIPAGTAGVLAAVLAALGMTGEFRHQTATATFLATPRRHLVVIAKLITYALASLGYGIICTAEGAAIALPWLHAKGFPISLTSGGSPGVLAEVMLAVVVYSLIGSGIGALLRDQVFAVVTLLVYFFAIEPIVMRIPALAAVVIYLPGPAGNALTHTHQAALGYLQSWQGGLIFAAYAAIVVAAGTRFMVRRDVS